MITEKELRKLSKKELVKLAKAKELKNISKMNKAQLVNNILRAEKEQQNIFNYVSEEKTDLPEVINPQEKSESVKKQIDQVFTSQSYVPKKKERELVFL